MYKNFAHVHTNSLCVYVGLREFNVPYFPHYKAHLKAFNFLKKRVRLIIRSALYGLIQVVMATVVKSVAE